MVLADPHWLWRQLQEKKKKKEKSLMDKNLFESKKAKKQLVST